MLPAVALALAAAALAGAESLLVAATPLAAVHTLRLAMEQGSDLNRCRALFPRSCVVGPISSARVPINPCTKFPSLVHVLPALALSLLRGPRARSLQTRAVGDTI